MSTVVEDIRNWLGKLWEKRRRRDGKAFKSGASTTV